MIHEHIDQNDPRHDRGSGHSVETYAAAQKGREGEQPDPPQPDLDKYQYRSHQCGYGPQKIECPEQE